MINLINIELTKIFHKKSIYIILLITILFCILNNILYYKDYTNEGYYKYEPIDNISNEIKVLNKELSKIDISKENNISYYLNIKSKIDILKLKKKYKQSSWQYNNIDAYLYDIIYQKNLYTYIKEDDLKLEETNKQYNDLILKLNNDNWLYFIYQEKEKIKSMIEEINLKIEESNDELERISLTSEKENYLTKLEELNYRINNNVKDDKNYLNMALKEYLDNKKIMKTLNKKESLTKEEKNTYNEVLSKIKINEYILKHKTNINKENTTSYALRTILEDYELFFVIIVIIVIHMLICEEFTSGTIKLLLIKPYSRCKILLSKFLSCNIILLISLALLIITELLVGTYLFGTSSLKLPVVIYNFNKNSLVEYSIWNYMLIRIISKLPFLIMLETITMNISVLLTNTTITITIPLLLYLLDNTLINITKNNRIFNYLINNHWHFEKYLFKKLSPQIEKSIMIWIIYFIIIGLITISYFKRKNIKNI